MKNFGTMETMNATIENPETPVNGHFSEGGSDLERELEFLWEERDDSGKAYELYLGRISRNPVVRSQATGKYFMLPWSSIIKLGVEHGLDEPFGPTDPGTEQQAPAARRSTPNSQNKATSWKSELNSDYGLLPTDWHLGWGINE